MLLLLSKVNIGITCELYNEQEPNLNIDLCIAVKDIVYKFQMICFTGM